MLPATSVKAADVVVGLPVQVPFVNQSSRTVPVGVGLPAPPLTTTRSWTIEPAGTVVTTLCVALWIDVTVVDGSCKITDCEPAPTSGGSGLQFVMPVALETLHVSC